MTCSTSGAVLIKTTTPPCLFWSFSSSQLRKKKKKGRRAARTRLWHRIPALIHPPTMRTVNASSSNTSPDLGAEKMPVGLAVEASKSLGVAYSEAKLERRGGWRIWMEVRRSEEEEEEGRWSGGWGWESKRGRKKRERQKRYIERKRRSMYSQWQQQPQDVAPVHLYSLLRVVWLLFNPWRKQLVENRIWYNGDAEWNIYIYKSLTVQVDPEPLWKKTLQRWKHEAAWGCSGCSVTLRLSVFTPSCTAESLYRWFKATTWTLKLNAPRLV